MSLIDTIRGRAVKSDPAVDQTSPAQRAAVTTDLAERRGELARQLALLQFDLGGLAYEMARRDHFRLDVIVRQAAKLQEVDAELGEVERLLRLDEAAAGGSCSACGALHARGAGFCWQCGTVLVAEAQVNGTVAAP